MEVGMQITKHEIDRRSAVSNFQVEVLKVADRLELTDTELLSALSSTLNSVTSCMLTDELRDQ